MKYRILFIVISVLLAAGIASYSITDRTLTCGQEDWVQIAGDLTEQGALMVQDGYEGRMVESPYYPLNRGTYTVTVFYQTSAPGNTLIIETQDRPLQTAELPVDGNSLEMEVTLDRDYTDFRLYVNKVKTGFLSVSGFQIVSDGPLYTDWYYLAALAAAAAAVIYYFAFISKRKWSQESIFTVIVLGAVCLLVSAPVFTPGTYRGDDIFYHIYKIEGMKDAMQNGQFPVYIYPYSLNGYGYLHALYPSLFVYPAALLRMLGVSLSVCYKSLLVGINIGTAAIAYFAARRLWKQYKWAPLLFSVLYLTIPYRLTNLWVRAALGELLATMFMPLVVVGLYELFCGDRKKWWILALGYSGLIQCHVLSCVMTALFSVMIGLFYADVFFREKRWIQLLKVLGATLLLNAWFLIPCFVYIGAGLDLDVLSQDFRRQILNITELFQIYTPRVYDSYRGYRSNSLGLSVLLCMGAALTGAFCIRKKNSRQVFYTVLLACGFLFTIMTTNLIPWDLLKENRLIDQLTETIQFSWRFLAFAGLCLVFSGVGWLYENERLVSWRRQISFALVLSAFLTTQMLLTMYCVNTPVVSRDTPHVAMVREYYIQGTDTGDLTDYLRVSDENKVNVLDYSRDGSRTEIRFLCQEEGQYLEIPVFHYPGYAAHTGDGTSLPLETGSNNRIRIALAPSSQEQAITVEFRGEPVFWAGYLISLAFAAAAIWYGVRGRKHVGSLPFKGMLKMKRL